jgi:hypothetical protein
MAAPVRSAVSNAVPDPVTVTPLEDAVPASAELTPVDFSNRPIAVEYSATSYLLNVKKPHKMAASLLFERSA